MKHPEFSGKTVIIADDEEYVRYHLSRRLEEMGLGVLQAGTGVEVVDLARRQPNLIIMDVRMPVLDGLETVKRLRSSEETRAIPIVLLSALAQQEDVVEGLKTGADEYVMKPVTFERLMESIRKHLR